MSNGLDPDQDRHFVGPDLRPNCLQTSKVAASKERVMGLLCTVQEDVLRMDAQACKIIDKR